MVTYILRSLHLGKIGRRRMLCTKSELCLHIVSVYSPSHDPSTLASGRVDTKLCIKTPTAWYRWLC
jgi:hypothetical protein